MLLCTLGNHPASAWRTGGEPAHTPQVVLLAAFSRPLSWCFQVLDRPPVLRLWCADETSSAQGTIGVPSLHLLTLRREEARKGRWAGGDHAHPQALLPSGHHRASVGGTGPVPLRFWPSTLLLHMKHEATDRFRRDPILLCNRTKWFVVLHHTMDDHRPAFSGKSVFGVFWPWSPFATHRRRTGVSGFTMSEHLLDLEIQFPRRCKEEGKNW